MKKLQNNFTTPEQSKRLLELGVPADSADMYCLYNHRFNSWCIPEVYPFDSDPNVIDEYKSERLTKPGVLPCWSVGRLIEIYFTCTSEYHPYDEDEDYTETPSLNLMAFDKDRLIDLIIEIMSEDEMDFSKLEE